MANPSPNGACKRDLQAEGLKLWKRIRLEESAIGSSNQPEEYAAIALLRTGSGRPAELSLNEDRHIWVLRTLARSGHASVTNPFAIKRRLWGWLDRPFPYI